MGEFIDGEYLLAYKMWLCCCCSRGNGHLKSKNMHIFLAASLLQQDIKKLRFALYSTSHVGGNNWRYMNKEGGGWILTLTMGKGELFFLRRF